MIEKELIPHRKHGKEFQATVLMTSNSSPTLSTSWNKVT